MAIPYPAKIPWLTDSTGTTSTSVFHLVAHMPPLILECLNNKLFHIPKLWLWFCLHVSMLDESYFDYFQATREKPFLNTRSSCRSATTLKPKASQNTAKHWASLDVSSKHISFASRSTKTHGNTAHSLRKIYSASRTQIQLCTFPLR